MTSLANHCFLWNLSFAQKNLVASLELGLAGLGVDAVFTLCCDFIQVRDLILIVSPFSCDLRNFFCRIYLLSFQVLGCHMIRQKAQVRMALSYVNIHYQMFSDYFSFSLGFSNLWATAPFSQALDGPYFKVEWIWMCSYGLRFKFHQYSGPI